MGIVQTGTQSILKFGFIYGIIQFKITVSFIIIVNAKIVVAVTCRKHSGTFLAQLVCPTYRAQSVAVIVQRIGSDAEIVLAVIGRTTDFAVFAKLMVIFYNSIKK